MRRFLAAAFFALALCTPTLVGAPYDEMDYGPFIASTYQLPWPSGNTTLRGIAVSFHAPIEGDMITPGAKGKQPFDPATCGVLFDTELLR
jgi:hypothetical protein